MGKKTDCEVLIGGAGPTGLTLGIELARRGISVPAPGGCGDAIYRFAREGSAAKNAGNF